MSKKLRKSDIIILAVFVIGSFSAMYYLKQYQDSMSIFHPKPLTDEEIKTLSNNGSKVVVYPILTQIAYSSNGFYDYYKGKCNSCTSISFKDYKINATFNMGKNGYDYLSKLNYPVITDIGIDKNPDVLSKYDTVILLHNEYMTKTEFNAISSHKNVLHLYPNSMYAEVSIDYKNNIMTLIKGHGYPDKNIQNGFGYVTSSQYEYDTNCKDYAWKKMPNGIGLTCYPEYLITYDRNILKQIQDYPSIIPPLVNLTKSDIVMPFCYHNGTCSTGPRDYSVP